MNQPIDAEHSSALIPKGRLTLTFGGLRDFFLFFTPFYLCVFLINIIFNIYSYCNYANFPIVGLIIDKE